MRAKRRRQRKPDPLAHPDAIRAVFSHLRERLPRIIPSSEKQIIKLLNAVRNIERRPVTDTKRGRPSKWERKALLRVASQLRSILDRETKGRVSLNSFIGLYIRILNLPKDIINPLVAGEITLFEAGQLARLTEKRLNASSVGARERRSEILRAHQLMRGSQIGLQARVNEQLGLNESPAALAISNQGSVTELVDTLLELNPYDTRHLFWEELRRIAFALRDIRPEDIDDKTLTKFLSASDRLSAIIEEIRKKRGHHKNSD